jgi:hypothetical protein
MGVSGIPPPVMSSTGSRRGLAFEAPDDVRLGKSGHVASLRADN